MVGSKRNSQSSRKLLAALCGLILLAAPNIAYAAADASKTAEKSSGVVISPPIDKLTLGAGLIQAKATVDITNNTQHRFTADVQLVDFKTLNQNGGLTLGQVGVPLWKYGLANWMTLNGNSLVSLAPGETTRLEVTIDNRADLAPGGHYGAVVLKGKNGSADGSHANQIGFDENLVSLLFIKKLGGEHYGLQLSKLDYDRSHDLPQSVTTTFAGTGNVYVIPRGYIEVKDPAGKLVARGTINQNSNIIMQDTSQRLISLLQPVASSKLKGKYSLTVHYRYEGQNEYTNRTVYFERGNRQLILPIIGLSVGVILLGLMYKLPRKRTRKHH